MSQGQVWCCIDLTCNALRREYGALQLPSDKDGEPSRSESDEVVVFTINTV
jgi:hypothetical protein